MDACVPFERLAVAFVALLFLKTGAEHLQMVSQTLVGAISTLTDEQSLREVLHFAFKKAAAEPKGDGTSSVFNIPAVLEQAWRTGVWGIMTTLVNGTFLIVLHLLNCAQEVLWMVLLFLFPLAAGVYPVFPRMMTNLVIYAVELSLWVPILHLVEIATGAVAKQKLLEAGSWGLYIVVVEVIAILLILMIPGITHRFLSGAFAGDFEAQSGLFSVTRKLVTAVRLKKVSAR